MAKNGAKLKARLPRGFADRGAGEIRATEAMLATIRGVYERYGFEPVETPLVEYTEALGKFLPDQDRPNEGVFSFRDEDVRDPAVEGDAQPTKEAGSAGGATGKREDWLSLRYDLTAPLARYVAENYDRLPKPFRSYRSGWVFRNEKPGPGRFRQFMQFDADTVGASSPAADAEMCMMAADTLEALGIPRGQYVIKVNSRKVLDGVMEAIGLGRPENAGRRLTVLRAIDKLDRLGVEGVRALLGPGRMDESGDFTKGAGLGAEQAGRLLRFLDIVPFLDPDQPDNPKFEHVRPGREFDHSETYLTWLRQHAGLGPSGVSGVDELDAIYKAIQSRDYADDRVKIAPSVVRGLEYYTGAVFEAELLFPVTNEQGEKVVFGSVGGGGRYDGLIGRFRGEDVPATGFSIGVSRLMAALRSLDRIDLSPPVGPVVVTVMDRERIADMQRFVASLRDAGIAAELYLGESGMKAQLKYADRRNSPVAVIQGEDERARGVVQIKDLALGKELSAAIADNAVWREERPGQHEVPEADLVPRVREILARQREGR